MLELQILALPAHSIAGLAVKAAAARLSCDHYWQQAEVELDWDARLVRNLIEEVAALAKSVDGRGI